MAVVRPGLMGRMGRTKRVVEVVGATGGDGCRKGRMRLGRDWGRGNRRLLWVLEVKMTCP